MVSCHSSQSPTLMRFLKMSFQRVAFAHSLASTVWTACTSFAGTSLRHHLVQVHLSLGALVADPVHQLLAAKSGVLWMDAVLEVALSVPFKQQWVLRCFKRWLFVHVSNRSSLFASRATTVISHTLRNLTLPLVAACWALPLCPEATTSKHLLWCLGILVMIPISCLSRCLSSERAVLAHLSAFTIWAFGASCAFMHRRFPDVRASCWTVGA